MAESQRVAELHINKARELAYRLFAYGSTIVPNEWTKSYTEQVVIDVYDFAIHARRINALCKFNDAASAAMQETRYQIKSDADTSPFIHNYQHALNAIMHASELSVSYIVWEGPKIFVQSVNNIIFGLKLTTDKFPEERRVNVGGLGYVFLGQVIPHIWLNYPQYRF